MTDIASFQQDDGTFDAMLFNGDLIADESLRGSVMCSLFSDAQNDDPSASERRGYWGDSISDFPGDRTGSLLWLLAREKSSNDVLERAKRYAMSALSWILDDGIASKIIVDAEYDENKVLYLNIEIDGPNGVERLRFAALWAATIGDPFAIPNAIADSTARSTALLERTYFEQMPEINSYV